MKSDQIQEYKEIEGILFYHGRIAPENQLKIQYEMSVRNEGTQGYKKTGEKDYFGQRQMQNKNKKG